MYEPPSLRAASDVQSVSAGLRLSHYLVECEPVAVDGVVRRLVYSTRSGATALVAETDWLNLKSNVWSSVPQSVRDSLAESLVLVPVDADELSEILDDNDRAVRESRHLEQVIQPSAACQLGCDYCGQLHSADHMAEHVQDRLVGGIARRMEDAAARGTAYESLSVGWFGAEPLLGIRAMRRLTPALVATATQFGASYSAHVVSNGLRLTPEIARELQNLHKVEHVEVTLDGTADFHDARRFTKAGRPSFQRIFNNLVRIAEDDTISFRLTIRSNVDHRNADSISDLIELLAGTPLRTRADLYFSPVYAWGNDAAQVSLSPNDYATREIIWLSRMMQLGFKVTLVPSRKKIVCLAVHPGSRVTDAFGNEYNCTEVPYVPAYGVPNRYRLRTVMSEPTQAPLFRDFNDEIRSTAERWCHSCRILPICGGACPKSWADGIPPCPSVKHNIQDRVLLNVARVRLEQ